ncbi:acyl-coenzyme A thioesterase THEM4-like [Eublepharis macularius]|uniref:Acyl-coenzyme A thioesterase THEM4 n=1 Tax=Eublepharis macularius TaxID=481883 RepID=A0AA97KZK8_EUBMA|nr:acyl-coenzyme A thioesterase THEM4-like [Eublepharis macularius]XP_054836754.1 acyl-coenzyme A thioesterase THEM4-like [Eublepharis macularius]
MLRSSIRMVAGLACRISPTCGPQAAVGRRPLLPSALKPAANATACFCQSKQAKDYALPNATWSQDMMTQYNKFMAMSRDGTWKRLPSYRHIVEHMPERMRQEHKEKINRETRLFLRNMDVEGKGFEYVMFVNSSEKRVVCVFQPGPYLEGPPGFAHGGCIATILDSTFGGCAVVFGGRVMTANLTINYKNPVPLGSVVLVDSKLDKTEGRKLFISGQVRSADGETLHTEATALFIQVVPQTSPQQPDCSE